MLKTQEHYDLIAQFDKEFKGSRLDKEPKDSWARGIVYQDGRINEMFLVYRKGYALGKALGITDATGWAERTWEDLEREKYK